jgi:hypothetical protein
MRTPKSLIILETIQHERDGIHMTGRDPHLGKSHNNITNNKMKLHKMMYDIKNDSRICMEPNV